MSGLLVATLAAPLLLPPRIQAANASDSYMRFDRMKAGVDPGAVLIVFTTSAETQTEDHLDIDLDTEWVSNTNFSSTATDYTWTVTGIPGTSTAMPISGANPTVSGNTITFALTGTLAASTEYAFFISDGAGMTLNPAASTTIIHTLRTETAGNAEIDTVQIASPTISDDQIVVVTASVDPTFTFTFSGNTSSLGTLSPSAISSGGSNTITVVTNASNGWTAWMISANAALNSAATSHSISTTGTINATPDTLSIGTEGYVVDVDTADGDVTVAAEYDGATTSAGGTLSSTTYQQIASGTIPTGSDTFSIIPRAAISGTTPAANDFTDTLTIVGAGVF